VSVSQVRPSDEFAGRIEVAGVTRRLGDDVQDDGSQIG